MVKFICLLRRKEGMSFDDFKAYYETRHSKLRDAITDDHKSGAIRYQRRYIRPTPHPIAQASAGADYDCILELWYPDRATLNADMAWLSRPDIGRVYADDEANLFDRRFNRSYIIDEETPSY